MYVYNQDIKMHIVVENTNKGRNEYQK